jgi:hypothetical protein
MDQALPESRSLHVLAGTTGNELYLAGDPQKEDGDPSSMK